MNTTGRCGYSDYAILLRMVVDRPGTTADLATRFGISRSSLRFTLGVMHKAGIVRVRDLRGELPVWCLNGQSVPLAPLNGDAGRGQDIRRFCLLVMALMHGMPLAPVTLQQACGIDPNLLRNLIRQLCEELRLAFVAEWHLPKRRGCGWVPHYRFGIDRDSRPHPRLHKRVDYSQLLFTTAGRQKPPRFTTTHEAGQPTSAPTTTLRRPRRPRR